jgi:anti-sigma B factor antagonist
MDVERTPHGLVLSGELDSASAALLDDALRAALLASTGVFVLDLSGLSFMDSGGVNELLRARSLLGREERELALVYPPETVVQRVLSLVGIADLFTVFATPAEAEAALGPANR